MVIAKQSSKTILYDCGMFCCFFMLFVKTFLENTRVQIVFVEGYFD